MIDLLRQRARRAIRAAALSLRTPRDGWLLARMLAWRVALPVLERRMSLPRLVQLMDADPGGRTRRPDREQEIARLAERVFDVGRSDDHCLERSLVTFRCLAAAGADPRLVVAIRKGGQLSDGHAWVTVDGVPVHDSPSRLADFVSLITFESGDRRRSAAMVTDADG